MTSLKSLAAVLGLAAATAFAQPPDASQGPPPGGPPRGMPHGPPPGGPGIAGNLDNLAILLDLDPYQKNEVQRVFTAQRDAMRAERQQQRPAGPRPSFEEMQARRQQTEDAIIGQLKTVLSDAQITKLKILMEARGGPGPRGPGGPGGPGGRGGPRRGERGGPSGDVPQPN
jgi:Spy/CpxP family protein refolding chaperone